MHLGFIRLIGSSSDRGRDEGKSSEKSGEHYVWYVCVVGRQMGSVDASVDVAGPALRPGF